MTFKLLPYNLGSASARSLATGLGGVTRLRRTNSTYTPRLNHTIINWGVPTVPDNFRGFSGRVINSFDAVNRAGNKLSCFREFNQTPTVPFTTDRAQAAEWLESGPVCVRSVLRGSGAEGLTVLEPNLGVDIPDAPLYTKYVPKREEYRIHIMNGNVIDIQKKILRTDNPPDNPNFRVRNHENGFIYVRDTANPHERVLEAAQMAVQELQLDFGAVDVIWNDRQSLAFVLEINTSPGLTGRTLENYVTALEENYG